MIFVLLLPAILAVLILWIVFVPVYIIMNTRKEFYSIHQAGTFRISLHPNQREFLKVRVLGFTIPRSTNQTVKKKALNEGKVIHKGKRRKRKSFAAWQFLFRGILESFECKRLNCTVDSGDVVLNAQLVPLMVAMNRGVVQMSVNFRGESDMDLIILCRTNKVIWTVIRFLTKK